MDVLFFCQISYGNMHIASCPFAFWYGLINSWSCNILRKHVLSYMVCPNDSIWSCGHFKIYFKTYKKLLNFKPNIANQYNLNLLHGVTSDCLLYLRNIGFRDQLRGKDTSKHLKQSDFYLYSILTLVRMHKLQNT